MATIEKNERAAKLRALAGEIRANLHNREAVADGFELIAGALEDGDVVKRVHLLPVKAAAKKSTAKKGA